MLQCGYHDKKFSIGSAEVVSHLALYLHRLGAVPARRGEVAGVVFGVELPTTTDFMVATHELLRLHQYTENKYYQTIGSNGKVYSKMLFSHCLLRMIARKLSNRQLLATSAFLPS